MTGRVSVFLEASHEVQAAKLHAVGFSLTHQRPDMHPMGNLIPLYQLILLSPLWLDWSYVLASNARLRLQNNP